MSRGARRERARLWAWVYAALFGGGPDGEPSPEGSDEPHPSHGADDSGHDR